MDLARKFMMNTKKIVKVDHSNVGPTHSKEEETEPATASTYLLWNFIFERT